LWLSLNVQELKVFSFRGASIRFLDSRPLYVLLMHTTTE